MANLEPDEQEILNEWLREFNSSPRDGPSAFGLLSPPGVGIPRTRRPKINGDRSRRPEPLSKSDLVRAILPYVPLPWSNWLDGDRQVWAEQRAKEWAAEMFDAKQTQQWLEIGVGPKEVALASDLRSIGLTPRTASVEIRGVTPLERVRSGTMSTARPKDLFRRENLIA